MSSSVVSSATFAVRFKQTTHQLNKNIREDKFNNTQTLQTDDDDKLASVQQHTHYRLTMMITDDDDKLASVQQHTHTLETDDDDKIASVL